MNRVAFALLAVLGLGTGTSAQTDQPPTSVATETLVIDYRPEEDLAAPLIIDELDPETVLTIRVSGFDGNTTGIIKQCVRGVERRCHNPLSVRFDDSGTATFQYLITDDVGSAPGKTERCRLNEERCTIELGAAGKLAIVDTVFVDRALPPGRLDVNPRNGLLVGDTVTVTASQFQPGDELTLMICAGLSVKGPRCGAPGPVVPLTIRSDGTAEAEVTLNASEVGSARVACGRRITCRMVVTSSQRHVRAPAVTLSFADFPGADYVATRAIIGLTIAVGLALLAAWLVRSTDWDPPGESDSTPIDEADYADLDLEATLFEEHDAVR